MASWDEKLLTAAWEGNIKEVELCVKNRANLECRGGAGQTPVSLAAQRGHLEVVTYLVTHGSQLETTSPSGQTPLIWAAMGGHLEVVTYLVTHGSQLDITDTLYGFTALHYAAWFGYIDVTKWLIDQGCSPWVKSLEGGMTPLMLAAEGGHLEVVTYLVTHGSQLEVTSKRGQTLLMLAARYGHLEVVTYLVTHGSQLDATDPDGETALHIAAENGRIDTTKWLIDQGCSPWVKSKQGETPYDLVTISRFYSEEKKKEVMDFLKTAMSKTSPEVTPDTHLQEPAAPVVEDSKIPEQIKKMDHESIAIYLNALESGSERRRDINLIIVGKKSVGKTSLVRRLFGEELQSVKSTNGIEIHRRRCRINLSNWEWNKVLDTRLVKETSINNRILQSIVKELHQDKEKPKHDLLEISSSDQNSTDDNKGTITKNIEHEEEPQPKHAKMNQFAYPEITESPLSKLAKDELLSIIGSAVDLQDEDGYANLTVWDFAGDIEYYNTHQTFLNSEAIFLVVANLHDTDDTVSYGTFNFWMDTIHCYGSINDKTEALFLEGAHNLLNPPVIAIGTHKDKFQDEEQCRKRLESYTDIIFKDSKLHLRSIHLISNTEDEEDAFGKLRNDIFSTAKSSTNWNREYPVKFIQIEKAINSELTIGKQIISFERLKELGEKIPLPITDDKELHLFLRYQHEIGNVIFFEDIPSYIILDPQWLANAFTCIVTAQQFQLELPHLQWDNFKQTGKMDLKLLEEIFKKQSADMRIHKEHILEVIEKFDIIIYPLLLTESGNVQREHSFFYVPCMLQTLKNKDIDVLFNVPNASKSTCLCFVFSFLPPYLISNLIVSCLREYPLAVVKGEIGLFKDCCVFNIDRTGCAKFVLAKSSHMIQLQVWQWDEVDTEVNQAVLKIVEREINRIINTRYKLKTVSLEKKWKCETTSYSFDTGFHEFDQVHDGENYYCEEHATVHKYKDYWSGEKSKAPGRLSREQQNYVRMSRIVLEVLSGVLYDRLFLDTKTGEILDRKKLDITEMCKKYCALKINFPSKGFRKIEKVDEISTIEDTIGDDIQRIRVIRNEMQHSSVFALDDTRYQTLITIVHDMLTRFDQRNNPAGESYVKRLDEIRKMELETRSFEEIKERMKAGNLSDIFFMFEVQEQIINLERQITPRTNRNRWKSVQQ